MAEAMELFCSAIGQDGQAVIKAGADWRAYRDRQIKEVIDTLREANSTQDALVGLPTKPCVKCQLPVVFKRNPQGKWWCFNPDGTAHFKLCGQI